VRALLYSRARSARNSQRCGCCQEGGRRRSLATERSRSLAVDPRATSSRALNVDSAGSMLRQEEVERKSPTMLPADWFSAVDRCQRRSSTRRQHSAGAERILLRDTNHFVALLQEIQTLAITAEITEQNKPSQRVIEHRRSHRGLGRCAATRVV